LEDAYLGYGQERPRRTSLMILHSESTFAGNRQVPDVLSQIRRIVLRHLLVIVEYCAHEAQEL